MGDNPARIEVLYESCGFRLVWTTSSLFQSDGNLKTRPFWIWPALTGLEVPSRMPDRSAEGKKGRSRNLCKRCARCRRGPCTRVQSDRVRSAKAASERGAPGRDDSPARARRGVRRATLMSFRAFDRYSRSLRVWARVRASVVANSAEGDGSARASDRAGTYLERERLAAPQTVTLEVVHSAQRAVRGAL